MNPVIGLDISKEESHGQATDSADAYLLGELFYKEEFEPFKKRGCNYLICVISRDSMSLFTRCVQTKLQFLRNWWPLQALTQVYLHQASLQQPAIELPNVVPSSFVMR
jgi:hypothetical protein